MLTADTYATRRAALEQELVAKRAAYEAEALAAAEDPKRAGARARLRNDVTDLEEQLRDLDAAREAAKRRDAQLADAASVARCAEVKATVREALDDGARYAAEIDAAVATLAQRLPDLVHCHETARRAVLRLALDRGDTAARHAMDQWVTLWTWSEREIFATAVGALLREGVPIPPDRTAVRLATNRIPKALAAMDQHFPTPTLEDVPG